MDSLAKRSKLRTRISTADGTYGTNSAPFLTLRVIKQLILDEGKDFLQASTILRENIYVDDVLFGADEISLLRHARDQVNALLQRAQLELRKWASNSSILLEDIPEENHGLACDKHLQLNEKLKILGISWSPFHDSFQFQVSLSDSVPNTKRTILSTIASLFDPLGWITPVTVAAKIFMQSLWRLSIGWDDIIPAPTLSRWVKIHQNLSQLNGLKISRWTGYKLKNATCELHGFADASTTAYAAAVYLRIRSVDGSITVTLLAGKSKVAPLNPITIPRLELSAAVLLSRLLKFVQKTLDLADIPCHCWTDSTVALQWLSQHPSKWKTFVSNRVAEVQSCLPSAQWHHISTKENPADCASRGILGEQITTHALWWHGPSWLCLGSSEWPITNLTQSSKGLEESKAKITHSTVIKTTWDLATRYSSWPKLIRVTAYILKFINRCQRNLRNETLPNSFVLSATDCQRAKLFWLRTVQQEKFATERVALIKREAISSRSPLLSLNPFLDSNTIIRVGGWLNNSALLELQKHPILLASHPVVELIIRHAHVRALHAGIQLTLATIRQEFWILRARNLIKTIIYRCVTCTREKASIPTQLMGNLPRVRITPPKRAFLHCGVDYAGPVTVRASAGRGITTRKAYIAVFVCLATRAIHLELVGNYSTQAFLDAYLRFCARRGLPESMYSDNGTNFVGADKELKLAYCSAIQDPDFLNRTASDQVLWHFIPPHAPHFGGIWQAGVRSLKHHLRRILGSHTLTFEELSTILCKIEACLNSRPLGALHDSLEEFEALTPGHFLIGAALNVQPEVSLLDVRENRLSRWQLLRQITERFWKVWQSDYINTLQQRVKWSKVQPSIQIGKLVLLRSPTLPPCKWELGRVIQCHPGSDGLVRVVTIKTANSEYKRPITQLCLLPIDIETEPIQNTTN